MQGNIKKEPEPNLDHVIENIQIEPVIYVELVVEPIQIENPVFSRFQLVPVSNHSTKTMRQINMFLKQVAQNATTWSGTL
jgi:hypothetical protein